MLLKWLAALALLLRWIVMAHNKAYCAISNPSSVLWLSHELQFSNVNDMPPITMLDSRQQKLKQFQFVTANKRTRNITRRKLIWIMNNSSASAPFIWFSLLLLPHFVSIIPLDVLISIFSSKRAMKVSRKKEHEQNEILIEEKKSFFVSFHQRLSQKISKEPPKNFFFI